MEHQIALETPDAPCIELGALPSMPPIMIKVLLLSFFRPSGLGDGPKPSKGRVTLPGLKLDPDRLARYRSVCGFPTGAGTPVPAVYFQSLFIGLLGRYITSGMFPVNPMGLIHTGQTLELMRRVSPAEPLDLNCTLQEMGSTDIGVETRFRLVVVTGEELVWQGVSTFLTRTGKNGKKQAKSRDEEILPVLETFSVARNTGRRYAKVSGDYNPHHLYGFSAKLIGFKQPIAHGMWSMARVQAALENAFDLAGPCTMSVDFKLPVFMPARVTLGGIREDSGIRFELRDAANLRPHLKGRFIPGTRK